MPTSLLGSRRDLRLSNHPAIGAAQEGGGPHGAVVDHAEERRAVLGCYEGARARA